MIQVHGVSARRLCDCQYKIEWINLHAYRSLSLGALKCLYNKYIYEVPTYFKSGTFTCVCTAVKLRYTINFSRLRRHIGISGLVLSAKAALRNVLVECFLKSHSRYGR